MGQTSAPLDRPHQANGGTYFGHVVGVDERERSEA